MIEQAIKQVCDGNNLSQDQMTEVIDITMQGKCSDEEITRLLTALYQKGETVDELTGAAKALRKHMQSIDSDHPNAIDTCGTGGSGANTFNISTAAAIVAAAAGATVAKHGNRASTSKTGSADVLIELGVNIQCSVDVVQKCLDELNLCFCFAPLFHPSVRHVMNVRRSLPFPTVFNLLGPLCNPAATPYQLLGAGRGETRQMLAEALALLGTKHSAVVHGRDGLGEVSCGQTTDVSEIKDGVVTTHTVEPADFGIESSPTDSLQVETAAESAAIIRGVLTGKQGTPRDITLINAASALWVSEIEKDLAVATGRCADAIDSGAAADMLERLKKATNQ